MELKPSVRIQGPFPHQNWQKNKKDDLAIKRVKDDYFLQIFVKRTSQKTLAWKKEYATFQAAGPGSFPCWKLSERGDRLLYQSIKWGMTNVSPNLPSWFFSLSFLNALQTAVESPQRFPVIFSAKTPLLERPRFSPVSNGAYLIRGINTWPLIDH